MTSTTNETRTWFVNFDDTDTAYVLAATESSATSIAIAAWLEQYGFTEASPEYQEMIASGHPEVREEPRVAADQFGMERLTEIGAAVDQCVICGALITKDDPAELWLGENGICPVCVDAEGRRIDQLGHESAGTVILLSTEF